MKLLLGLFTWLMLVLPSVLPAAQVPLQGGRLVVCQPTEPPGLDPTANTAAAIDRVVYANVFEGLVKVDARGRLVPGLADNWQVSSDGLRYTFRLHQGVRFHDGASFNARVAVWNLKRAAGPQSVNPHPEYFRGIEEVRATDDHRLAVRLKAPDALFLAHLAEGDAVMLSPDTADSAKSHPVGTGPFQFVRWVRGARVELARFENYRDPRLPYLDRVTFQFIADPNAQIAALKAGDIDVIGFLAAPESAITLARDHRFKILSGSTTGEVILSTNNRAKPFDNLLVRQAMAYAIDRQTVVDLAMFGYGTPIGSHWSPATPYFLDLHDHFAYDPAKSRQLLAQAGYPKGFSATLKLPASYSYARRSGEVVADMLGKVGIRIKLEIVEWGQWIERVFKKKDYQLTIIGHVEPWDIGIYADPNYYFQYDSDRFREALHHALQAATEADKAKWFGRCQQIVADDAVNGFLFSAPSMAAMKVGVMGWWENYPTIALDCSRVWWRQRP